MLIREEIERECCHPDKDLKPYQAKDPNLKGTRFCVHCGQIWKGRHETSPCGDKEYALDRIRVTDWDWASNSYPCPGHGCI